MAQVSSGGSLLQGSREYICWASWLDLGISFFDVIHTFVGYTGILRMSSTRVLKRIFTVSFQPVGFLGVLCELLGHIPSQ